MIKYLQKRALSYFYYIRWGFLTESAKVQESRLKHR